MKIIVDTNVVMDILLKREPFFQASYNAIRCAAEHNFTLMVSASAVTDIFYLLRREIKDAARARESLGQLLTLFEVADVLSVDVQVALLDDIPDFEDAIVHAVSLRHGADMILTRNEKDYANASVAICCPDDFFTHYAR